MKPSAKSKLAAVLFVFSCCAAFGAESTSKPADIVFKNGKVWTDPSTGRTFVSALSVRGGHILSLGSDKEVLKDAGEGTRTIDLKGKVILPSFNDSQLRLIEGGLSLLDADLWRADPETVKSRLKVYAAANPGKKWIVGRGWDSKTSVKKLSGKDLDTIDANRPIALLAVDEDALLLNAKAAEALGAKTENGWLRGAALGPVTDKLHHLIEGGLSDSELSTAVELAQSHLNQFGITSVQGRLSQVPLERKYIQTITKLYRENKLKLRVSIWGDLENPSGFIEARKMIPDDVPPEWMQIYAVNLKLDGSLGAGGINGAALMDPNPEIPLDQQPEPKFSQKKLTELVVTANKLKIPVIIDAHGDRASTIAVGAMMSVRKLLFNSRIRNRIDSLEMVPAYLYPALANNNLVAGMELSHFSRLWRRNRELLQTLGRKRMEHFFAWRNFIKARVHYSFGSDWPTLQLNPFQSIQESVTRENSSQKLSVEQALEGYTSGPAYATHEDHFKGALREGMVADLIVVDQNPFTIGSKNISKVQVQMTLLDGKVVYDGATSTLKASP